MTDSKKNNLRHESLERLIEEEMEAALLEEGLADWVKGKVQDVSAAVQAGWQKLSAKAKQVFGAVGNEVANVYKKIAGALPSVNAEYQAVAQAFQQEGGNVESLPGVADLKALTQASAAFSQAATADAQQTKAVAQQAVAQQQQQQQAQQPQAQPQAQESYIPFLEDGVETLREVNETLDFEMLMVESHAVGRGSLNEVGVMSAAAIALASPKLIIWLLGFLRFIAKRFDSEPAWAAAVALTKAQNWVHHKEHALIDKIPNKVAFTYYAAKMGLKTKMGVSGRSLKLTNGKVLTEEEFAANKKVRMITKLQMHKIVVMGLLGYSVAHLLHGIHGFIGGLDVAASVAKVAELGTEGAEIVSNLGSLASAAADAGAGAASTIGDLTDIADLVGGAADAADATDAAGNVAGGGTTK